VRTAPLVVIEGEFDGLSARMRTGFSITALAAARPPRLSDLAGGGSATITIALRPRSYEITVRTTRGIVYEDDCATVQCVTDRPEGVTDDHLSGATVRV
jgi:hypothetical protein